MLCERAVDTNGEMVKTTDVQLLYSTMKTIRTLRSCFCFGIVNRDSQGDNVF